MTASILLVRRAYGLGGAELYNLNLAMELRQQGYRPLICTQQPELRRLAQAAGIKVINPLWLHNQGRMDGDFGIKVAIKYAVAAPIIMLQYLYYLLRYNVRALYVQTRDDQIFGTLAARLLGRRAVWADHGDLKLVLRTHDPYFQRVYHYALGLSAGVVCVAEAEKKLIASLLPECLRTKLVVIHNGVSLERFSSPPKATSKELVIGSTARVQPQKGVDVLVRAFAQAVPKLPAEAALRLAGVVDDPAIVALADELGIKDRVQFVGGLANTEVPAFLRDLDIYVFPSLSEVFPLSVLEAMMASRPVIATTVGGIPEVIKDGSNGILVPPNDAPRLAAAMIQLASASRRRTLAQAAHALVEQTYDFHRIVERQILPLLLGEQS